MDKAIFTVPSKAGELALQFVEQAASMQRELNALDATDAGMYVVTISDLPMLFGYLESGAPTCRWVNLREATRFGTEAMAAKKGSSITNGNGERGVAVRLDVAYANGIRVLTNMVNELNKG